MSATSALSQFALELATGQIRIVDLTQTLSPEFPSLQLPPQFGQCWPFRMEEISRYDERGPAWYWNKFSMSEHTGTHFDAPVHRVSGKDFPNNALDTIPPEEFVAHACVIDCSREAAENPDFLLTVEFVERWEATHGRIPPAPGCCCAPTGPRVRCPTNTSMRAKMAPIRRGPRRGWFSG